MKFDTQARMHLNSVFSGFLIFTLLLSIVVLPLQSMAQPIPDNSNRYIIILNEGISASDVAREHGFVPDFVYSHAVNGFAGPLSPKLVEKLSEDNRVKYIEKDQIVHTFAQTVPNGIKRINGSPVSSPETVNAVVAIIDTGINLNHPDLNVNIEKSANCAGGSPFKSSCSAGSGNGEDGNGHGSHVAGTVGAVDNNIGVVGVAPGVELWAVRVLDNNGSGYMSWIIAGIDYVTANADSIDVANMSLGCECSSGALDDAISRSINAGIVYAVAAGNSAKDASTFSPANHPDVITVSAIADFDGKSGWLKDQTVNFSSCSEKKDDSYACFSNFGDDVEIAAPGVNIYSTYKDGGYATLSGTSMASPHVAGAAAKYIAQNNLDPKNKTDVQTVISALIANGWSQNSSDGYIDDQINVYSSTEPLLKVSSVGSPLSPPSVSINDVSLTEGDSGSKAFTFTVTRSHNSGAVSVDYYTSNGNTDASDFTSVLPTTINFADNGSLTQDITIDVTGDNDPEPDETFNVNLTNCVACSISDGLGIGTILDDDNVVIQITFAQYNPNTDKLTVRASSTDPSEEIQLFTSPDGSTWIFIDFLRNKGDGTYDGRFSGITEKPYQIKIEGTSGTSDIGTFSK